VDLIKVHQLKHKIRQLEKAFKCEQPCENLPESAELAMNYLKVTHHATVSSDLVH